MKRIWEKVILAVVFVVFIIFVEIQICYIADSKSAETYGNRILIGYFVCFFVVVVVVSLFSKYRKGKKDE